MRTVETACACGCGAGTSQQVHGSTQRRRAMGGGSGGGLGSLSAEEMRAAARITAARTTPSARGMEEVAPAFLEEVCSDSFSVRRSAVDIASCPLDMVAEGRNAGEGGGGSQRTVAGLTPSSPTAALEGSFPSFCFAWDITFESCEHVGYGASSSRETWWA